MENSNQLLHFLTAATSNLQSALSQPSNGKKVNHRKYIQKRLQRTNGSNKLRKSNTTKTTSSTSTASVTTVTGPRPQPVATTAGSVTQQQPMYWQPPAMTSTYEQYYFPPSSSPLPLSSAYSSPPYSASYSRPPSCPVPPLSQEEDELESLLTEIGLNSSSDPASNMMIPPPHSASHPSVSVATTSSSLSATSLDVYLPSDSPLSDFSDIDDSVCSAYSSPRNPSPVCYPSAAPSPHVQSRVATASCEWLQPSLLGGSNSVGGTGVLPTSYDAMPNLGPSLNDWNFSQLSDLHVLP